MDQIASLAVGIISSLAAEYVPALRRWLAKLSPVRRFVFFVVVSVAWAIGVAIYRGGLSLDVVAAALSAWLSSNGARNLWRFAITQRAIRRMQFAWPGDDDMDDNEPS